MANKLKIILPHIGRETQNAFVPDRLITNNALVAFECFYYMKKKIMGRKCSMAFKLYMSKAYGRVEWIILRRVLEQLGIPTHQVDLILRCVSTITFSVLVNGHPSKEFKLQRGIYPYLFILCAKAFSMMLSKVVEKSSLQGIRILHHPFLIFCLQMIVFFFLEQLWKRLEL